MPPALLRLSGMGLPLDRIRGRACAHHAEDDDDGWAENNRRMCDLLHRGRIPPRLLPAEREDEFCAAVEVS